MISNCCSYRFLSGSSIVFFGLSFCLGMLPAAFNEEQLLSRNVPIICDKEYRGEPELTINFLDYPSRAFTCHVTFNTLNYSREQTVKLPVRPTLVQVLLCQRRNHKSIKLIEELLCTYWVRALTQMCIGSWKIDLIDQPWRAPFKTFYFPGLPAEQPPVESATESVNLKEDRAVDLPAEVKEHAAAPSISQCCEKITLGIRDFRAAALTSVDTPDESGVTPLGHAAILYKGILDLIQELNASGATLFKQYRDDQQQIDLAGNQKVNLLKIITKSDCPVCLEEKQVILTCGHQICRECLNNILQRPEDQRFCPICRNKLQ